MEAIDDGFGVAADDATAGHLPFAIVQAAAHRVGSVAGQSPHVGPFDAGIGLLFVHKRTD